MLQSPQSLQTVKDCQIDLVLTIELEQGKVVLVHKTDQVLTALEEGTDPDPFKARIAQGEITELGQGQFVLDHKIEAEDKTDLECLPGQLVLQFVLIIDQEFLLA